MGVSSHYKEVRDYLQSTTNLSAPIRAGLLEHGNPDAIVMVRNSGGPPPTPRLGGNTRNAQPTVQILVRGESQGDTSQRAETVYEALQDADIPGYDAVWMQQPGPLPLGPDEQGRHRYTVNIRLMLDE